MTSQPCQQTIVIHILPNTLRSEGNYTMKFGQLMECNMRNIFLEKSYAKCDGKTIPRHFSKKCISKSVSLDPQSMILQSLLLLYTKLRTNETY